MSRFGLPHFLGLCTLVLALAAPPAWSDGLADLQQRGVLRWGADAEGGAPYVFKDPGNPDGLIGFEWELAALLATELGVQPEMVQNQWDKLLEAIDRNDFDVAMNGIEVTDDRQQQVEFTRPYYVSSLQLAVRRDQSHVTCLGDLRGRAVGTLKASLAERVLRGQGQFDVRAYEGQVDPYEDLKNGRIDGVLMDLPIAQYYARPDPALIYAGPPTGQAFYAIAVRKGDVNLLNALNQAIGRLIESGKLRALYERWAMWNDATAEYFGDTRAGSAPAPAFEAYLAAIGARPTLWSRLVLYTTFLPSLARGATLTLLLSVTSMALAICFGLSLAVGRLYGPRPLAWACYAWVELIRGTPLLVQLYILYYGLPYAGILLSAPLAAILGLSLNYGAYEAENYRAGIQAIPRGQMEAALALGMTRWQSLRHVILPQAVRIVIPPVTNDFISLLKDSSIVSVITMVELTKEYGMLAAAHHDYLGIGLLAAAMYFLLGWPFARMARWTEKKFAPDRAAVGMHGI